MNRRKLISVYAAEILNMRIIEINYSYNNDLPYMNNIDFVNVKKYFAVDRIRTCAGRAQWISSPSP